ncbi:M15 family metallopeptidase [Paenibacillus sp. PAMC21692]|uniref:M15 family metallopeptidase n=1 Tax=Paenibacillus sp. PAMC21692 TaxID=2762320 RepID=UPI0037C65DC1
MPEYRPQPTQHLQPSGPWPPPHRRSTRGKSRRIRNWLVLLFLLMFVASMLAVRTDELGRILPFIQKDAPPVTGLHPIVLAKSNELVEESAKIGIEILITDDFRSHVDQDALFEQGRTAKGPIVTHARGGESFHNYGLAIDFALKTKKGQVIWDMEYDGNRNGEPDWLEVVNIAKGLGFSWGGDWKGFKDYPHLQMDFGYSISELQRGYRP